jgi:hypothetical protein
MRGRALAVLLLLAVALSLGIAGCGNASDDTGTTAAPSTPAAQKHRMREITAESRRLLKQGEWAQRNAEDAALYGEMRRQRNAERLMVLDFRKMKALNREAEAIVKQARQERASP